jgi:hypothetical protein
MVIFKIHIDSVFPLPLKGDAPRAIDMQAVPLGLALQWGGM